jgi:hypothetical protein
MMWIRLYEVVFAVPAVALLCNDFHANSFALSFD